ncbi:VOC family protein [Citreicella sp. C3M06]|uniref:VOC family protein n=1 Tax=Citreicella sp. C3M06 TaxID=2841564 RepID=UPI001C081AC2|nr:VOC family protein [Citreicella sp. C3M06]MBU2961942.1 VOC family protein [Citreicella sp. C3M06]
MLVNGLHHVTALGISPRANNAFWTQTLGLRRVKTTVNFDAPDVYHLYFGDAVGTPGSVMTYFPHPNAKVGREGTGEVSTTAFSIPKGATAFWQGRLGGTLDTRFGDKRLEVSGPDGDALALVEGDDPRTPWTTDEISPEVAIRGFQSVELRLSDIAAEARLLTTLGYTEIAREGDVTRYSLPGNGANSVDLRKSDLPRARYGAGRVHHVAFSVPDRDAQLRVRDAMIAEGMTVTEQIDRDYFWAIYFRTPGGVLFEIATDGPGFDRDEPPERLGEALQLPLRHEHLRKSLQAKLEPLG